MPCHDEGRELLRWVDANGARARAAAACCLRTGLFCCRESAVDLLFDFATDSACHNQSLLDMSAALNGGSSVLTMDLNCSRMCDMRIW